MFVPVGKGWYSYQTPTSLMGMVYSKDWLLGPKMDLTLQSLSIKGFKFSLSLSLSLSLADTNTNTKSCWQKEPIVHIIITIVLGVL